MRALNQSHCEMTVAFGVFGHGHGDHIGVEVGERY